jgi:hypothetical protein
VDAIQDRKIGIAEMEILVISSLTKAVIRLAMEASLAPKWKYVEEQSMKRRLLLFQEARTRLVIREVGFLISGRKGPTRGMSLIKSDLSA